MIEYIDHNCDIVSIAVSGLGFIGVILTIIFTMKAQTKAIENQWYQEFYKQRMSVYLKASKAASMIAYLKDSKHDAKLLKENILEFQTLYGGQMAVLEKKEVEKAMVRFKKGLDNNISNDSLKDLALYLSHVLRNESSYDYEFKNVVSTYGNNTHLLKLMDDIINNPNNYQNQSI